MKKKATCIVLASAIVAGAAAAPLAGAGAAVAQDAAAVAQDAAVGQASFAKCQACHAVGLGAENKLGPELDGLADRQAGATAGYQYSPALKSAGFTGISRPSRISCKIREQKFLETRWPSRA